MLTFHYPKKKKVNTEKKKSKNLFTKAKLYLSSSLESSENFPNFWALFIIFY